MSDLFDEHLADRLQPVRRDGEEIEVTLAIPESFPYFDGHFPGRPVLPGLIALEISAWLAQRLVARGADAVIVEIGRSKFVRNIHARELLRITIIAGEHGSFRCQWRTADGSIAIDLAFTLGGIDE